ncbi:MAG: OmpH family outer membrane protein [Sulfurifustis sp.]
MKSRIAASLLLLAATLTAGVAAYAQDLRVGYVDMRRVMTETKSGKRVKAELEKTFKQRQEALARDQEELKKLQEAYEKDKLLLSDAQKQSKQREFDDKMRAYQKSASEAQREIDQKQIEYSRKAFPEVQAIIRDLAKEQKLVLVFEKHEMPVLYAVDGPDLTDKVIQRLDAKGGG